MIKKRLILLAILIIILISSGLVLFLSRQEKEVKKIHYHAGFVVFKNNKQVDFSDLKYMVIKPCTIEEIEEKEDLQIEKAHLHDEVGDVVHVEAENAKWSDLFTNLHYSIDYKNSIAYINHKKIKDFQNLAIKPYDSLVILIGTNDIERALSNTVSINHIKEAEKRSEGC